VDASLNEYYDLGVTADELFAQYTMFGDFVVAKDAERVGFSAWDYIRMRCAEMVAEGPAARPDQATEPET